MNRAGVIALTVSATDPYSQQPELKHTTVAVSCTHLLKSGEIKAVWIACTNPAQSMPDQGAVRDVYKRQILEFSRALSFNSPHRTYWRASSARMSLVTTLLYS